MALETIKPADGSRVVRDDTHAVLFGQPPEVLKGLLLKQIRSIDTLILTDTRERDGSLLNNLEFPLYYFLFIGKGTQSGTRLNLVGDAAEIARVLRLLQLTLLGPVQTELQRWGTPPWLQQEWLNAARHLALKGADGRVRSIESFFNIIPFMDGTASDGRFTLRRLGTDRYEVAVNGAMTSVDLCEDLVTIRLTHYKLILFPVNW